MELSVTAEPAHVGTTLEVGPPKRVPSPGWEALLTVDSAFEQLTTFSDVSDRLRLTRQGR